MSKSKRKMRKEARRRKYRVSEDTLQQILDLADEIHYETGLIEFSIEVGRPSYGQSGHVDVEFAYKHPYDGRRIMDQGGILLYDRGVNSSKSYREICGK